MALKLLKKQALFRIRITGECRCADTFCTRTGFIPPFRCGCRHPKAGAPRPRAAQPRCKPQRLQIRASSWQFLLSLGNDPEYIGSEIWNVNARQEQDTEELCAWKINSYW